MECHIHIAPVEGSEPEGGFREPPQIRVECNHPAFDREVEQDVRNAFQEFFPQYEQHEFLTQYEYPYQFPHVATVEWYPEKSVRELADDMATTEKVDTVL